MKKSLKYLFIFILLIMCLSGCGRADKETSFDIISELCKANFAPSSEKEYMDVYNKYKGTCISEEELTKFFDIGKTVHTNVKISNYRCSYVVNGISEVESYEAIMKLDNGSIYSNIKVTFRLDKNKIVNTTIEYLTE